ncbi:hypothetical protein Slin14017_G045910 [Septoria linicola]|nr:hypothetical protein Slin14017_G045910 [Septoria linicola]
MIDFETIDLERGAAPPPYAQLDPPTYYQTDSPITGTQGGADALSAPATDHATTTPSAAQNRIAIRVSGTSFWSMWRDTTTIAQDARYRIFVICMLALVAVVAFPAAVYVAGHKD